MYFQLILELGRVCHIQSEKIYIDTTSEVVISFDFDDMKNYISTCYGHAVFNKSLPYVTSKCNCVD